MRQRKVLELTQDVLLEAVIDGDQKTLSFKVGKKEYVIQDVEISNLLSWLQTEVLGVSIAPVASVPLIVPKAAETLKTSDNLPKSPWDIPQNSLEAVDMPGTPDKIFKIDVPLSKRSAGTNRP